jgi:hypothetical protein
LKDGTCICKGHEHINENRVDEKNPSKNISTTAFLGVYIKSFTLNTRYSTLCSAHPNPTIQHTISVAQSGMSLLPTVPILQLKDVYWYELWLKAQKQNVLPQLKDNKDSWPYPLN